MIGIIKGNRHIRIPQRLPCLRTRKNDILHGCPSQLLDPLLSQHPAHSIRNITLSTAIRSYNARNAIMKLKFDLVCKGFESVYFNTL